MTVPTTVQEAEAKIERIKNLIAGASGEAKKNLQHALALAQGELKRLQKIAVDTTANVKNTIDKAVSTVKSVFNLNANKINNNIKAIGFKPVVAVNKAKKNLQYPDLFVRQAINRGIVKANQSVDKTSDNLENVVSEKISQISDFFDNSINSMRNKLNIFMQNLNTQWSNFKNSISNTVLAVINIIRQLLDDVSIGLQLLVTKISELTEFNPEKLKEMVLGMVKVQREVSQQLIKEVL